jgi:TetR/AcrR family transcriptional regulator, repressor for uid operon
MTAVELRPDSPTAPGDRQALILVAAERAFVRHGFHATTMQHVAAEAGMSPGNLYRYFRSKEAIVAGLCSRDQAALAEDFAALARADDIVAQMERMLRSKLIAEPRQRFQLVLEIWAEATRNPTIAAMMLRVDAEVRDALAAMVASARERGLIAPQVDADFAVRAICTVGIGLFKRRAHEPDFDGEAEVALGLALVSAVLSGTVTSPKKESGDIS